MLRFALQVLSLSILMIGVAQASTLTLERVVSPSEISSPIQVAAPAGDAERLFILDRQKGAIFIQNKADGTINSTPFFTLPNSDFAANTPTQNAFSLAFAPDYAQSGKFYVSFINKTNNLQIVEAAVSGVDADIADPMSMRQILTVPYIPVAPGTHFGADLDFGPDGYLYITTGDGDVAFENVQSQNLESLQGKILRVDPSFDAFPSDPINNFTPATGNPFSGSTTEVTDAIWALGLRNPFQASFDPLTGKYLVGDVGEDRYEEVNVGIAGANFGWPGKEGYADFKSDLLAGNPDLTEPLYVYEHGLGEFEGFSITGGAIYSGSIAALNGLYFFADYVRAQIWSFRPDLQNGTISELILWSLISPDGLPTGILSFGVDAEYNLYIVAEGTGGGVYRIANASLAAVPMPHALPLLISGLGIIGFIRWHRRQRQSA